MFGYEYNYNNICKFNNITIQFEIAGFKKPHDVLWGKSMTFKKEGNSLVTAQHKNNLHLNNICI